LHPSASRMPASTNVAQMLETATTTRNITTMRP
jgi:hypothetical protein